jgi:hypothetical protein
MNAARNHYICEYAGDRYVATRMTQAGHYIAYLGEPPGNMLLRGRGHTRAAAIADLVEQLNAAEAVS